MAFRPRHDAAPVRLGATPIEIRPNGSRVYRGVAAFGDVVLDYGPGDPGGRRSEFVPADVALADETVRHTVGLPFTLLHPEDLLFADREDDLREVTEGSVIAARANRKANPPELEVDVVVNTESAQEAIESGAIRELSLGYEADSVDKEGVGPGGKRYQQVQVKRRPNHLSAVRTARSGAPDGRRARLDATALAADLTAWSVDALTYPRLDMGDDILRDPAGDDDSTETTAHADEAPPPAADACDADASPEEVAALAEPMADPAAALAAFSPEAVEILKTLPPADLAMLVEMAKIKVAEEAEQAVMAAPDPTAVEVEVEDASAGARERESIGETMKVAAKKAESEVDKDATVPQASQALTADAVAKMISDALMARDAATKLAAPAKPAMDAAAALAKAKTLKEFDAAMAPLREFEKHVQSCGHRLDATTKGSMVETAFGVIKASRPEMLDVAKRAANAGRFDDLKAIFDAAEDARRESLLSDQFAVVEHLHQTVAGEAPVAAARLTHSQLVTR
jgi:hypothetical protein